jgi:hypothetical protein
VSRSRDSPLRVLALPFSFVSVVPFHKTEAMPSEFDLFSSVQALSEDASLFSIPNELDVPNCDSSEVEDALNGVCFYRCWAVF